MERDFSTAYNRAILKREAERAKKKWMRTHPDSLTIDDFLRFMEIKSQMGIFQSFDPKEFGGDYEIVSIPKDGTPEAEFWFGKGHLDHHAEP